MTTGGMSSAARHWLDLNFTPACRCNTKRARLDTDNGCLSAMLHERDLDRQSVELLRMPRNELSDIIGEAIYLGHSIPAIADKGIALSWLLRTKLRSSLFSHH